MNYDIRIIHNKPEKVSVASIKDRIMKSATTDTIDEETNKRIININCARKITGVETVKATKDEPSYEREVDNLELLLDETESLVTDADEYLIEYHVCYHDEEINHPCQNWRKGREKKGAVSR